MNVNSFKGLVTALFVTIFLFLGSTQTQAQHEGNRVSVYRNGDGTYAVGTSVPDSAVSLFTTWAPGTPNTFSAYLAPDGKISVSLPGRVPRGASMANIAVKSALYSKMTGASALTGTRLLLEVLQPECVVVPRVRFRNGECLPSSIPVSLTTNWEKASGARIAIPDSFVSDWLWGVPADAKGLWVANANPQQTDPATGLRLQGSYFDFQTSGFPRVDYGMGSYGFLSVDNSRDTAYYTQGQTRINRFKFSSNDPIDLQDNTPLLTSLVDERTGKLIIIEGGTVGGGVWVQDPKNPRPIAPGTTLANEYLRARDVRGTNGLFNEEIVRAQLFGDMLVLWRGTTQTVDGYTRGQMIVYNVRDWIDRGVRTTITVELPDAVGIKGPVLLGPAAFDTVNRRFWVNYGLQRAFGSVTFSEDFTTATVGEMKYLPKNDGEDYHSPNAMYFDSAMGRLYIASHRYGPPNGYLNAELAVYSVDGTRLAAVRLPIADPSDITIAPMAGKNYIVVASMAGAGFYPVETVVLDPVSLEVIAHMPTLRGRHLGVVFE